MGVTETIRKTTANARPAPATDAPIDASNIHDGFEGTAGGQYRDPLLRTVIGLQEPIVEAFDDLAAKVSELSSENKMLRVAIAELKSVLAETTAKSNESAFILQKLRELNKGDVGPPGIMGPPGITGAAGRIGPVWPRGTRGQPGDRIVNWRLSPEEYLAFAITETGKELPPLNLLPFFATYNTQTEASEVDLAAEQVAESRAALELETVRVLRGLPARYRSCLRPPRSARRARPRNSPARA
jgi:hypothetical protein